MNPKNYTRTLQLANTPMEVFNAICDVAAWWTINIDGDSRKVGDVFTVQFGDVHFTEQEVVEAMPGHRLVWHVTQSRLPWLKDREEWKGTRMVFEITATPTGAQLVFTHIGLLPTVECYAQCEKGWDYFIDRSLRQLLENGVGLPDTTQRTHMDTIGHVRPANA